MGQWRCCCCLRSEGIAKGPVLRLSDACLLSRYIHFTDTPHVPCSRGNFLSGGGSDSACKAFVTTVFGRVCLPSVDRNGKSRVVERVSTAGIEGLRRRAKCFFPGRQTSSELRGHSGSFAFSRKCPHLQSRYTRMPRKGMGKLSWVPKFIRGNVK